MIVLFYIDGWGSWLPKDSSVYLSEPDVLAKPCFVWITFSHIPSPSGRGGRVELLIADKWSFSLQHPSRILTLNSMPSCLLHRLQSILLHEHPPKFTFDHIWSKTSPPTHMAINHPELILLWNCSRDNLSFTPLELLDYFFIQLIVCNPLLSLYLSQEFWHSISVNLESSAIVLPKSASTLGGHHWWPTKLGWPHRLHLSDMLVCFVQHQKKSLPLNILPSF